ncbi:hypothetical protein QE152_g34843 [Popillia japonica]|uniref:Uncharacterized protein n=1 Tax=Popillia japonica TaxID=7064 RepID=A0AAW1ITI3_POPJA
MAYPYESNSWRILMKVILECDGTYDVVDGNSMKPEQGVEDYMAKLDCWTKANSKAKKRLVLSLDTQPLLRVATCETAKDVWNKLRLVLSLDTQPLLRVATCETAKDVWNKLHQIYDNQSAENIDLLRNKFHNIEWEWSGGVQGHLAKFDEIQTKMTMLKKPIDEGDMCARFLQTLPKEFDHIYVTWHDLSLEDKTWLKLTKRCLNYELRIAGRDEGNTAIAMMSKSKTNIAMKQPSKPKFGGCQSQRQI